MKITVYGKPGCGVCMAVKRYLHDRGVRYREFDISRDPDALQEMVDLTGGARTVPVVAVGDTAVIGFAKDRLDALINAGE